VRIAAIVLSDTDKWYNDAGQQLKKSLGKFDQSLHGGEFVIVSGMRVLRCAFIYAQILIRPSINLSMVVRFLNTNLKDEERKRILKWIYNKDTISTHNSKKARRTPGTGAWFLSSPEFENWIEGTSSNTLICYGIRTYLQFNSR
jgi:hypothetical protein